MCKNELLTMANKGDSEAQYNLFSELIEEDNIQLALEWLEKAAIKNYEPALLECGRNNLTGIHCDADVEKAFMYFKRATLLHNQETLDYLQDKICIDEKIELSDIAEKTRTGYLFEAADITFNLSDAQIFFYKHQNEFYQFASDAKTKYLNMYKNCSDIEPVIKNYYQTVLELMVPAIVRSKEICISNSIYDMNEENLLNKSSGNRFFNSAKNALEFAENEYGKLLNNAEATSIYREQCRTGRGRFIGGGFGFSGAVKGMMTAGALNMASGALHGIGDSFTDSSDRANFESGKRKLLRNTNIRDELASGVYRAILGVLDSLIPICCERSFWPDVKRAETMFNNLINYEINKQERTQLIKQIFSELPDMEDLYKYCLGIYGDYFNEFETIASVFSVDLHKCKISLFSKMCENIDINDFDSQIDAEIKVLINMKFFGLHMFDIEDVEWRSNYQTYTYKKLSVLNRTVQGIVCDSIFEREKTEKEVPEMQKIIGGIDLDNLESIRNCKPIISKFETSAKQYFLMQLDGFDKKIRTVNNITYETMNQVEEANGILNASKDYIDENYSSIIFSAPMVDTKRTVKEALDDLITRFGEKADITFVNECNDYISLCERIESYENVKPFTVESIAGLIVTVVIFIIILAFRGDSFGTIGLWINTILIILDSISVIGILCSIIPDLREYFSQKHQYENYIQNRIQ